ncbi:hypothetical protein Cgig2_013221 [Carnegiea gigantea]|uniref:Uncharacterized protein n=1 Tax=Carnegiea gigantea TaxID=171969 RepID=A0A9Q1KPW4_9CARY|nr:hypothetical protein Cgig2_013221 [Carnegiea gigantea]
MSADISQSQRIINSVSISYRLDINMSLEIGWGCNHEVKGVLEGDIQEVEAIDLDSGGGATNVSQLWTGATAFTGRCEERILNSSYDWCMVIRDQWNVGGADVAREYNEVKKWLKITCRIGEESSHSEGLVKGSVMDEELQISLGNEFAPEEWRAVYRWWKGVAYISECLLVMVMMRQL